MIDKFIEFVKQSPIATEKFINHCIGVYKILKDNGCSEEVCNAGLYHSIYGNSYIDITVQTVDSDRDIIKKEIGEYAENLVYEMCILPDRENDILTGKVDWNLKVFKDIVKICLANILELKDSENLGNECEKIIYEYQILEHALNRGINPFKVDNSIHKNIKVFDDYIPISVRHHLWYFATHSKYTYGHRSQILNFKEESLRFSCYLNRNEVFDTRMYPVFQKIVNEIGQDLFLNEYYIGNYNKGTCAESHLDAYTDGCVTILVYPNLVWDESWGGDIKFYKEETPFHTVIDFVPGRIIVFDSKLEHKVLPLSSTCQSNRFSFAFKALTHGAVHDFLSQNGQIKNLIHIATT